jgi:tetratricopeptide (TPR) repeat protein
MRFWCAGFLVLVGVAHAAAQGPTLKDARQRLLRGNYAEARAKYEALAKNDKHRAAAAVGLSRVWESQGEYETALAVVEAALRHVPTNADLLARKAEVQYLRGRWEDAEKTTEDALKARKEHFLARWIRAQVYRDRGDLKKADEEFRWFVRTYSDRSESDKDITDPEELVLVALAGAENARWHPKELSDQFEFILKTVYKDALKADKDYWWAEYHAGMLLLEKHNPGEAQAALGKAQQINESAAEVLAGRGMAALQKLDMEDAEEFARRALAINPRLPEALRLRADVFLAAGDLKAARRYLEKAREVNGRDESTLARIAACYHLQGKGEELQKIIKEVEKYDTRPGVFYSQLAHQLEEHRRFEDAEKHYKKAMALRPMLVAPQSSLGLLYMRMAREPEAKDILDKAFAADEYDVRVFNTLRVLKHLEKYAKIETKHFLIRFDAQHDPVLARFMANYLEAIYDKLAKEFNYQPKGPILIELFNNHHMFSGRVIALPDLHTIGACTGRMFAMVSPRDQARIIRKPFNWARVLRHEMVHIYNLEQTNFQIPHWFTEGLAVMNEGFPRPPSWNQLLLKRVPDKLLNLNNINLGFMHPKSQEEWNLAYLQSLLYVEYLKTFGDQTIGKLLDAFRRGLDTPSAIREVCKKEKAEFEKGYRQYVERVAKEVKGQAAGRALSFNELKKALKDKPDDADLSAQLAAMLLDDMGDKKEALVLARKVLDKKPNHPLASYVRARLLVDGGETDQAITLLKAALNKDNPELKVAGLLGKLCFEGKKYEEAAEAFKQARKVDPYQPRWLVKLAQVYARAGKDKELTGVLKELAPTDADDISTRKRLAELLLKVGNAAEAEQYAREALEIDVLDKDAQKFLEEALGKQKGKEEALKELRKMLGK